MQPQTNPPPFITRAEAAALLRLSNRSLDKLIAAGEVPAFRLGRRVLIRRAELEALK